MLKNLFTNKKKLSKEIFQLFLYGNEDNEVACYNPPQKMLDFYDELPTMMDKELVFYKYLLLKPDRYKDTELKLFKKGFKETLDVEGMSAGGMKLATQRFKDFIEGEKIPLDFFPVKVKGERRYIMMWRRLPVYIDYEADLKQSEFYEDGRVVASGIVYRSDVLEYRKIKMFSLQTHTSIYLTGEIRQKLEENDFLFNYHEKKVTQKKLNPKKVEKDLLYAIKKSRESGFNENSRKWYVQIDESLEKVLIEEGDKEVLERFRKEMKGAWKKDFERYEKGLMKPDERITYW
ncbi:hypothetical protein HQ544_02005 [Candidatus Falkowbacteria bacterium]|nr:hypothetical protein [Candidatus Falkowbacteria bacterium]